MPMAKMTRMKKKTMAMKKKMPMIMKMRRMKKKTMAMKMKITMMTKMKRMQMMIIMFLQRA